MCLSSAIIIFVHVRICMGASCHSIWLITILIPKQWQLLQFCEMSFLKLEISKTSRWSGCCLPIYSIPSSTIVSWLLSIIFFFWADSFSCCVILFWKQYWNACYSEQNVHSLVSTFPSQSFLFTWKCVLLFSQRLIFWWVCTCCFDTWKRSAVDMKQVISDFRRWIYYNNVL